MTSTKNPKTRAVVFSSATDDWPTPKALFDELDDEFGFSLDVCASSTNHKAGTWYGLDHPVKARRDGLDRDWVRDLPRAGRAIWMNPPYGRGIGAWMSKARDASDRGATVVCLVPARTDTAWFHDIVLTPRTEIRFLRGRVKFGDAKHGAPFASLVVVFHPVRVAS